MGNRVSHCKSLLPISLGYCKNKTRLGKSFFLPGWYGELPAQRTVPFYAKTYPANCFKKDNSPLPWSNKTLWSEILLTLSFPDNLFFLTPNFVCEASSPNRIYLQSIKFYNSSMVLISFFPFLFFFSCVDLDSGEWSEREKNLVLIFFIDDKNFIESCTSRVSERIYWRCADLL